MKKAFLVDVDITTRVVVDVPVDFDFENQESPNYEEVLEKIGKAGVQQFRKYVKEEDDYPYLDNVGEIEVDDEVPYGEAPEDENHPDIDIDLKYDTGKL